MRTTCSVPVRHSRCSRWESNVGGRARAPGQRATRATARSPPHDHDLIHSYSLKAILNQFSVQCIWRVSSALLIQWSYFIQLSIQHKDIIIFATKEQPCNPKLKNKKKTKKSFKCSQENGWFIPMQTLGSWPTLLASSILLLEKQIPPIA